ncbi:MAG: bifunctional metallophosphatase/5'-nucleotidase, partial [Treponema sp.]|nr:bifunctional metallophosphatase/5'-nucleotidase [Treponema sp.]
MKRLRFFLIPVMFVLGLNFLLAEPVRDSSGQTGTQELVLLHTNDHHGVILPNGGRGGLAEVAAYVKAVKATSPQVLLVDAGDFNTGSAFSNMFD